jgi:ketosteroid isomerase-like protein
MGAGMTDHDDVEAANAGFYSAFEAADLDAMRALWLDDPGTLCIHPGQVPVRGTRDIDRSWALLMANTAYIQFFLTDVEISVLPEAATVTCTENVLTGAEDSRWFGGARVEATNVFVRRPDGWRLWVHRATPVLSGENDEEG